jgi:hypothetical protein
METVECRPHFRDERILIASGRLGSNIAILPAAQYKPTQPIRGLVRPCHRAVALAPASAWDKP